MVFMSIDMDYTQARLVNPGIVINSDQMEGRQNVV